MRPYLLISSAFLLQAAAWFLPVVTSVGGGQVNPIVGWQSFLIALSAAWGESFGAWYDNVLAILSVVTTLFFLGSSWVVFRGTRSRRHACAWIATAFFLFNAHWYVRLDPNGWISGLGIGYFLWWCSFALLAVGLFDLARGSQLLINDDTRSG